MCDPNSTSENDAQRECVVTDYTRGYTCAQYSAGRWRLYTAPGVTKVTKDNMPRLYSDACAVTTHVRCTSFSELEFGSHMCTALGWMPPVIHCSS
ncbi:Hypothetical predicted protein, partial [Pelobates cultripes]